MQTIKREILNKVYKKRKPKSHKGNFGEVLVIGGSEKYTGAPGFNALSALAVLRSGTDLVKVASPERAANIIASFSPDIITIPLKGDKIKQNHVKTLLEESKNPNSFVIGSGIEKNSTKPMKNFLRKTNIPGVLDAEAIKSIKRNKTSLGKFILTPHSEEFRELTGESPEGKLNEKAKIVEKHAKELNTTILLKGKEDIISNGKETKINKTGNKYMTKGGTGDILAGITAALVSQRNSLFESACAAAYINGVAGDLAAKEKKQALIASDLLNQIEKILIKQN